MQVAVDKILALCKEVQERTGEENPKITYEEITKVLFPAQWKLDNYYLHRRHCSDDDDPDCYCE